MSEKQWYISIIKQYIERIYDKIEYNSINYCWEWTGKLSHGYGYIGDMHKIHRIMYINIYGSIPTDRPFILHRCDNRKCCNPTHLYAGTPQNNIDDRENRNRGNHPMGENCSCVKLTEKQVLEIRASKEPQTVIAKRFNVSQPIIHYIRANKTWKHI